MRILLIQKSKIKAQIESSENTQIKERPSNIVNETYVSKCKLEYPSFVEGIIVV